MYNIKANKDTESCPSWSKEHDWKSCKRLKAFRGFESLALRQEKKVVSSGTAFFLFYFFAEFKLVQFSQTTKQKV